MIEAENLRNQPCRSKEKDEGNLHQHLPGHWTQPTGPTHDRYCRRADLLGSPDPSCIGL